MLSVAKQVTRWLLVYPRRAAEASEAFVGHLSLMGQGLGIKFEQPDV